MCPHQTVIVACCKNEAPFIKEWILYHELIGFEHFYIYDAATDNTREILQPFIDRELVTYIDWSKVYPAQVAAYRNFIFERRGVQANWAAFIDLDEYIIPINERLSDLLASYDLPHIAGLAIGWSIFGSSNNFTRPKGLITENYTHCVDYSIYPERFTKGIVRPFRVSYVDDPHIFRPKTRTKMIREDGKEIKFGQHHHKEGDFPVSKFRINHYFCKSFSDFQGKIARGGPDGGRRYFDEFAQCNKTANAVEDKLIQKFVPELRRRMNEKVPLLHTV